MCVINNECELKFKIKGNLEYFLKDKNYTKSEIVQVYLDFKDPRTKIKLKSIVKDLDTDLFKECRVRLVDNKKAFLTLKSDGDLERKELETELDVIDARRILSSTYLGGVFKTRYNINIIDSLNVTIDKYKDRELMIAEVEFDKNKIDKNDVEKFMNKYFKYFSIENVTYDKKYKNSSLAR